MLKISVVDGRTQRRLIVEGNLIAPWLDELKRAWVTANSDLDGREAVIELADVSVISTEGENALLLLMNKGVRFRCHGVHTRHLIQQLARKSSRARAQ